MVKSIDLSKGAKIDLTKPTNNFDLSKPDLTLNTLKAPVITLGNKKPLATTPKKPWDIDITDPVEGMKKISIPLLPIDLYYTPDEVVDPQDCGRYPNSPYCGGIPFSFLPVGFEPEIVIDQCNIGIGIQPVLFFIKLPQQQIVFRKRDCYTQPPPAPPISGTPSSYFLPEAPPGCFYYVVLSQTHISEYVAMPVGVTDYSNQYMEYGERNSPQDPNYGGGRTRRRIYNGVVTFQEFGNHDYENTTGGYLADGTYFRDGLSYDIYEGDSITNRVENSANGRQIRTMEGLTVSGGEIPVLYERDPTIPYNHPLGTSLFAFAYAESFLVCHGIPYDYVSQNPSPPSPLPPPKPDDMNCCPQLMALLQLLLVRVNQLDGKVQLLDAKVKLVDDKVKDTNKCLGTDEFPAALPKRLIYPNATGVEKINNLVQAFGYQVKQIDKAVGYLPQKIKVLDTNSAVAGNQSVEVEIHSFADFAKETLQYLIDTEGDEDTLANIAVRILYECGAIHQLSVQIAAMVDAAIEHLDFKEGWKTVEVPFAYDPYAGQKGKKAGEGFGPTTSQPLPLTEEELEKLMPDLLKETLVKIKVLINTQKRTLNDLLQELLRDTRLAAAGVSENASSKRLVELVDAAQAALQLQNTIARNNVRKALTSGDLRTRKKPK